MVDDVKNWDDIVADDQDSAAATSTRSTSPEGSPRAAPSTSFALPELPEAIGRLPIRADTKTAVVQLPEPVRGVSCAAVFANSSVVSDCYTDGGDVECGRPAVKYARPVNDRDIEVVFWGSQDGKVAGLGWQPSSGYPGGQLETRSVEVGVPFVEVKVVAGRTLKCGCDSEKWASDEWGT